MGNVLPTGSVEQKVDDYYSKPTYMWVRETPEQDTTSSIPSPMRFEFCLSCRTRKSGWYYRLVLHVQNHKSGKKIKNTKGVPLRTRLTGMKGLGNLAPDIQPQILGHSFLEIPYRQPYQIWVWRFRRVLIIKICEII